ncbi:MAG: hypothetical protein ACK5PB_07665 [Pirellula sp.]|jgi:subtilisin family serine protease
MVCRPQTIHQRGPDRSIVIGGNTGPHVTRKRSRSTEPFEFHFQVVAGLGLPGLVQVRSISLSEQSVRDTLSANVAVVSFSKNERVSGQIQPNDSDFGNMTNLHNVGQFDATNDADIDAPEAWDVTRGSTSVVVGVIDSGVDPTHPDLYLIIWLISISISGLIKERSPRHCVRL